MGIDGWNGTISCSKDNDDFWRYILPKPGRRYRTLSTMSEGEYRRLLKILPGITQVIHVEQNLSVRFCCDRRDDALNPGKQNEMVIVSVLDTSCNVYILAALQAELDD